MRYRGDDEATEMNGTGLYQGADGTLYEWVEGRDARGDAIGFFQEVTPPEEPELSGLGALYEAPDGTLYHMQGLAEEAEAEAEAEQEEETRSASGDMRPRRAMGIKAQRRRRFARRRFRRPGPVVRRGTPGKARRRGGLLKKLLPVAKLATRFIPVPGAGALVRGGLNVASKLLKRKKGVAGYGGLGLLYAAPDGSLYQVQEAPEEPELKGFAEDDELRGPDEDEELRGVEDDEELRGLDEDEEPDDLSGCPGDQVMEGIDGYVRQDGMEGLEAYVPQEDPQTPWHVVPVEPPEIWKPLW